MAPSGTLRNAETHGHGHPSGGPNQIQSDRFINEGAVKTARRAQRENKVRMDINGPVVRKNTIGNARRAKRGQSVGLHVTLNKKTHMRAAVRVT